MGLELKLVEVDRLRAKAVEYVQEHLAELAMSHAGLQAHDAVVAKLHQHVAAYTSPDSCELEAERLLLRLACEEIARTHARRERAIAVLRGDSKPAPLPPTGRAPPLYVVGGGRQDGEKVD